MQMANENFADVAQTALVAFDPIDFEKYQDGGGSGKDYAPPAEGRYIGKAPIFKDDGTDIISESNSFGRTNAGYLKLNVDGITLVDGKPGYTIRYQTLSAKKYAAREGSQVLDFLRACGIAAKPKTDQELRAACKMASGRNFTFQLVWEAYNKDTQENYSIADMEIDPMDASKRLSYKIDPYDSSKKWFANGKVRYFVSAIKA